MSCLRMLAVAFVVLIAASEPKGGARIAGAAQAPGPAGDAVERGRQIFTKVGCYQCHGREAQGASTGPRLGPHPLPLAAFTRAIRAPRGDMPPYSLKLLSDTELADVYAFVAARPRPHPLPR